MKLFIIRHGETQENVNGILMGHHHGVLTEKGKQQAREIAEALKNHKFSHIFSSDLNRCVDTVEFIKEFHVNTPVTFDKELRELNMGILQGKRKDLINWETLFNDKINSRVEGGETLNELKIRGLNFLRKLNEKYPNDDILLVTHNGWMAQIIAHFLGIDSKVIFDSIGNAQVFEIEVDKYLNGKVITDVQRL